MPLNSYDSVLSYVSLKASVYISGLMSWALTPVFQAPGCRQHQDFYLGLPAHSALHRLRGPVCSSLVWNSVCSVERLQDYIQLMASDYFRTTRPCTCLYSEFACLPDLVFSIKPRSGITSLSVVTGVECVN